MQRAAVDIGQESALAQTVEMVAPVAGDKGGRVAAVSGLGFGAQDTGGCKGCNAGGYGMAAGQKAGFHGISSSLW